MKRIFLIIIFLILFLIASKSFAFETVSSQLSAIEKSLWKIEYTKENHETRLNRIEKEVLGDVSKETDTQKRIDKINQTLGLEGAGDEEKKIAEEVDAIQSKDVEYPAVDKLERQIFNKTYQGEGIYKRIERLEEKVFASKQEGDLNQRLEKLNASLVTNVPYNSSIPQYQATNYGKYQKSNTQPNNTYNYDDGDYWGNNQDVYLQIAGLENTIFRKTYDQDPMSVRLNRLERKIFQRDFSSDDEATRLQRIQAASTATKTAKYYDSNKFQKYTSTGIQVGTFILMILSLIL